MYSFNKNIVSKNSYLSTRWPLQNIWLLHRCFHYAVIKFFSKSSTMDWISYMQPSYWGWTLNPYEELTNEMSALSCTSLLMRKSCFCYDLLLIIVSILLGLSRHHDAILLSSPWHLVFRWYWIQTLVFQTPREKLWANLNVVIVEPRDVMWNVPVLISTLKKKNKKSKPFQCQFRVCLSISRS